jgi:seryl-tRNA synthetase
MRIVSDDLHKLEEEQIKIEEKFTKLSLTLPNMIHESVPIGKDDTANKEIKKWGDIPSFDFEIRDHICLTQSLDLVDLERAAKVSGARFYYLKNQLVRLNQALLQFALDFLVEKNYIPIQTPFLINKSSMEGAIIAQDFQDVIYKIEGEELYLIGTSEHAVVSMHSDEIIDGKKLPLRYAGISTCFRKEAGAHGRDQKGIFRVHQFEKVEQFAFTRPEDSWYEHERMLIIAEEFYQKMEIPYRIMLLSSGDLGKVSAKTYDLEAWMAGQKSYREIVSCSNCLDFQARRLKIRFRDRTDEQPQYLHSLNSTLVATTRTMVAIIENFQTKDGHIAVPKVLQKYVGSSLI